MIEQYAEAQWDMNMSRKRTEADRGNFGSSVRGLYLAVRGMFYRIGGSAGTWWNGMLQCPKKGHVMARRGQRRHKRGRKRQEGVRASQKRPFRSGKGRLGQKMGGRWALGQQTCQKRQGGGRTGST